MKTKTILFLAASLAAVGAHAQVYRCTGPDGKTIYTDAPCQGRQLDDAQLRSNTMQGGPRLQVAPAAETASAAASPPARRPGVCPSALDVRNIETAAASSRFTPGSPELQFMQREVALATSCDPSRSTYTADDWKLLQTYHSYQSRIDAEDRRAAREKARALHELRTRRMR